MSADIQTALTVLGRRPQRPESERLDFSGTCLRGADLRGLNFRGASFASTCLEGADLFSAFLQSATLTGACMMRADLSNANLQWAHMAGVNLQGATLFAAQLGGGILTRARMQEANLLGADLQRTNLLQARLEGANLNSANLSEAGLVTTQLQSCRLVGARLLGASLRGARLDRADLTDADFSGANLNNCSMRQATTKGATFADTNLSYDQLSQIDPEIWPKICPTHATDAHNVERNQRWAQLSNFQRHRDMRFASSAREGLRNLVFTIEDLDEAGIWPRDIDDRSLRDLVVQVANWANSLPDVGFAEEWTTSLGQIIDQWWPSYPRPVQGLYREVQEIRRTVKEYQQTAAMPSASAANRPSKDSKTGHRLVDR
ncbi:pentapeptide repeat-containing protein [Micromonospora sp. NPDC005252]|uniref:pentapeptide repeat-containing protein n=1 Tax=Micromonospora sp. NPDC005252 TaxID=3364228 RepID=UPI0036B508B7